MIQNKSIVLDAVNGLLKYNLWVDRWYYDRMQSKHDKKQDSLALPQMWGKNVLNSKPAKNRGSTIQAVALLQKLRICRASKWFQKESVDGMIGSKSIFYIPIRPSRRTGEDNEFDNW